MLYADRVIEYSEFKQINILKKEGKMDGQLKVAAVQVTVEQNNIKKNMENVEKMAINKIDGVDQRFEKTKNKLTSKETMYVRTGKEH